VFIQEKKSYVNTLFTFLECNITIPHQTSGFKGALHGSINALKKAFRRRPNLINCISTVLRQHFPYTKHFTLCKGKNNMFPQLKISTKRFDDENTNQTLKKAFRRRPNLINCSCIRNKRNNLHRFSYTKAQPFCKGKK